MKKTHLSIVKKSNRVSNCQNDKNKHTKKTGKISEVSFYDPLIKKRFKVKIDDIYTTIQIGDRYYYFDVGTGKFDGTGHDCK